MGLAIRLKLVSLNHLTQYYILLVFNQTGTDHHESASIYVDHFGILNGKTIKIIKRRSENLFIQPRGSKPM